MAFGGKLISASRKQVPGSYQQHAWHDSWQESIDIDYDGELTAEVQAAIKRVFMERMAVKGGSLNGVLRAPMDDGVVGVDVEKRQLIISGGCRLSD